MIIGFATPKRFQHNLQREIRACLRETKTSPEGNGDFFEGNLGLQQREWGFAVGEMRVRRVGNEGSPQGK